MELQFNKAMNLMDNGDGEESVTILEQVSDIGIMDPQYRSYGNDALLVLAEFFERESIVTLRQRLILIKQLNT